MRQRYTSLRPTTDLPEITAILRRQPTEEGAKNKSWYSIKNLSKDETEVFIYDEIGFWGVTASDFLNDLAAIKTDKIALRINSPGGDVSDGIAIYNGIRRHDAEVNVFIDGLAASSASFIAMSGDAVMMSPHAQMMIHDAWGFAMGPADEMAKMAEILDKVSDNIAGIYAERTGGEIEDWRALMKVETWFSDREAVAAGLADGIDGEEVEEEEDEKMPKKMPEKMEDSIEEEPESAPEAPDFNKLFEDIVEDEEYALA